MEFSYNYVGAWVDRWLYGCIYCMGMSQKLAFWLADIPVITCCASFLLVAPDHFAPSCLMNTLVIGWSPYNIICRGSFLLVASNSNLRPLV